MATCCEIALRWMPHNHTNDKSTLVKVMAWCRQATSHCLNQCWLRSLMPHSIIRPQWVQWQWVPYPKDLHCRKGYVVFYFWIYIKGPLPAMVTLICPEASPMPLIYIAPLSQPGTIITWSNITWYCIQHGNNTNNTSHFERTKGTPYLTLMCKLSVVYYTFWEKWPCYYGMTLSWDSTDAQVMFTAITSGHYGLSSRTTSEESCVVTEWNVWYMDHLLWGQSTTHSRQVWKVPIESPGIYSYLWECWWPGSTASEYSPTVVVQCPPHRQAMIPCQRIHLILPVTPPSSQIAIRTLACCRELATSHQSIMPASRRSHSINYTTTENSTNWGRFGTKIW